MKMVPDRLPLLSGCPGAAGEAGEVAVFPPSDPPAEQRHVRPVRGAGPDPAQRAGWLPRLEVRSGVERQYQGETRNSQGFSSEVLKHHILLFH